MIYIFGDSHANFNMKNFSKEHINLYQNSITKLLILILI